MIVKTVMIIHRWTDQDPRCNKIIRFLLKNDYKVIFLGIKTQDAITDDTILSDNYTRILYYQKNNSRVCVALNFIQYVFFVVKNIFLYKPYIIHSVNEEIAFLVLLLKNIKYKIIVLDIFDSLILRINKNKKCYEIVKAITRLVYKRSDYIIVTDEARMKLLPQYLHKKTLVVYNTPDVNESIDFSFRANNIFTIGVIGSISQKKGLKELLCATENIDGIRIDCFGILADEYSRNVFIKNSKVFYKGMFSNEIAIQETAKCDLIFAFYEPSTLNNIYASPNKLFEAMYLGKPILMNSEVKMSKIISENDFGGTVPYYSVDGIKKVIKRYKEMDRKKYEELFYKERNFYCGYFAWENSKNNLLKIYKRLSE